jgi:flagellar M-ring protein FliF
MEWFKKIIAQVQTAWKKWTMVQKIIFFSVIGAVVLGFILLVVFSSRPSLTAVFNLPITDEEQREQILLRLDEENIGYKLGGDNMIYVPDEKSAKKARAILFREDLVPKGASPWDVFNIDKWSLTDFERNVNFRRALTTSLEQHIEALDDIDDAEVTLVVPEEALFSEQQNPVKVSVVITPSPGSDISGNRKKIEGLVKLIQFAVDGLEAENITILDHRGTLLNDFEGLEDIDRLTITKKMLRQKKELEEQYTGTVLKQLQGIYGEDRVKIINIDIDLEFVNKKVEDVSHPPIVMREDNPETPYSELLVEPSVMISTQKIDETFKGTGFNPEGPPGMEGQTPPAYKDLSNMVGSYENHQNIENYEIQTRKTEEQKSPYKIQRITVAVAIDGIWKWKYDEKGQVLFEKNGSIQRDYLPVPDEDLKKAQLLVEHAVGYDPKRGDAVTVQHITFDRTKQFAREDSVFRKRQSLQKILLYSIMALGTLIVAFIVFRMVSREIERRRRMREEELARQHQAMREQALRNAEEEGVEVEMSVADRARQEATESAKSLAREHPEDVAQLIRTWLAED